MITQIQLPSPTALTIGEVSSTPEHVTETEVVMLEVMPEEGVRKVDIFSDWHTAYHVALRVARELLKHHPEATLKEIFAPEVHPDVAIAVACEFLGNPLGIRLSSVKMLGELRPKAEEPAPPDADKELFTVSARSPRGSSPHHVWLFQSEEAALQCIYERMYPGLRQNLDFSTRDSSQPHRLRVVKLMLDYAGEEGLCGLRLQRVVDPPALPAKSR